MSCITYQLSFRLKKVSMPLGEVSVSSTLSEENARETASKKEKDPPPIAAFFAMDINKSSPSKENKV